ncbi:MAG: DnaJ C-terminal domain-containing protein [Planctomycetota bacterium]|jgi:DnaJ-class molecular chaperone
MSQPEDYYKTLGVKRDATPDEIRQAYRMLARTYHPDVNKSPEAEQRFNEVTEAYEVLSDEEKRGAYDRFGHAGVGAAHGAGGPGGPWRYASGGDMGDVDLGSIFEQMFGGRGGSPFGAGMGGPGSGPGVGPARARSQRGQDVQHRVGVTFMTAAQGGTEHVRVSAGGRVHDIDVKIPPGIEPGAKLRVKGKGGAGSGGGAAGDLIITVEVGAHPYFRREGLDLYLDVPITLAEAATGTSVDVPLLDGSAGLKIPPGSSSGQKLRLRDKGVAGTGSKRGDFYAVVQIVAPEHLSERGRELIDELANELENPRTSEPWV